MKSEPPTQLKVVVVGGGVSGCACAGRLAVNGAHVIVVSSALDVVGLPGYGPEVRAGQDGWNEIAETLALLPEELRWAWLNAGSLPDSGEPVLVVDRRAVSIESKRALETLPGVDFRQGLVTDVRFAGPTLEACESDEGAVRKDLGRVGDGSTLVGRDREPRTLVEIETAFGEVFQADAVVLAPGLALGGRIQIEEETLPGGRYGEVPADDLYLALAALGVTFEETVVDVGPHFSRDGTLIKDVFECSERVSGKEGMPFARRLMPARILAQGSPNDKNLSLSNMGEALRALGVGVGSDPWPDGFPPSPHWTEGLRADTGLFFEGVAALVLAPDGAATAEYYLDPQGAYVLADLSVLGVARHGLYQAQGATRQGHLVHAFVATGVDGSGRLPVGTDRIRIAGRACGATSYLESLRSGVKVADSLLGSARTTGKSA